MTKLLLLVWQPWGCTLFCRLQFFSLLIIHVLYPHKDIQMGVELSPLSYLHTNEKSNMAAITIYAYIENAISPAVIELET